MKETEVVTRLDRIIELIETMGSEQLKKMREEVTELHDWRITTTAIKNTKTNLLSVLRWGGPWVVAFLFVLFEHKFMK